MSRLPHPSPEISALPAPVHHDGAGTWLTIAEAAAYLRCSTKHLRNLVHRGSLPERRVSAGGRLLFLHADLDAFVGGMSVAPLPQQSAATPDTSWLADALTPRTGT